MTENEAKKLVESMQIAKDCEMVKTLELQAVIIKALEDVQAYRAIGTVEECRQHKDGCIIATVTINKDQMQEMVDEKIKEFEVDIQATRNAAIDEFSEKLKYELNGNIFSDKEKCAYDRKKQEQICHQNMTLKRAIRYAEVIAEQMKGGA